MPFLGPPELLLDFPLYLTALSNFASEDNRVYQGIARFKDSTWIKQSRKRKKAAWMKMMNVEVVSTELFAYAPPEI